MTKPMTIKKCISNFLQNAEAWPDFIRWNDDLQDMLQFEISQLLDSVVPDEQPKYVKNSLYQDEISKHNNSCNAGFNSCRQQLLENIKRVKGES